MLPAWPGASGRRSRRSCRAPRLVLLPALLPRSAPATLLPVSAAPRMLLSLLLLLVPARAALADRSCHSPSAATAPASRSPAAPCTPAASPLNTAAIRLLPRRRPHTPLTVCFPAVVL